MQATSDDLGASFTLLRQSLRSYLRRRLPDPSVADDLLQDVFVKALITTQSGRNIDNLTGWLYAAARTALIDHFRSSRTPTTPLPDDLPGTEPDDPKMHQALAACLQPFIERLPPPYRDTIVATELHGMTMRALAEAEGVSVSAIKSRAARGRSMLKKMVLACCHVELSDGLVSDCRKIDPGKCSGCA